jgi:hypothetical protein
VGTYRCHSTRQFFLFWLPNRNAFQAEDDWDPSTAFAVGGEHLSSGVSFPPSLRSHSKISIDSPEIGPGSVLGPSGVSTHPISSSTATGLPISGGGNSKAGAIAGGVVGGIAAVAIAIAVIILLRRHSQPEAPSVGIYAPQPLRPLSIEGVPSSPTTIKSYVSAFVPYASLVCPHMPRFSYYI